MCSTVLIETVLRMLLNMYSRSEINVRWRDKCSSAFIPLHNGVIQGGVLSPTLFTSCINGLLDRLRSSGLGCHVGRTYAGAFGYADDIALVAHSLLCFNPCITTKPNVVLCGKSVEVVNDDMHLGNRIYTIIYKNNIEEKVSAFIDRAITLFLISGCVLV